MEVELAGDVGGPALPTIAAAPDGRTVYAAFVTRETGADFSEIAIAVSSDRGATWSAATPVAPGAAGTFYFQPQLAVDGAGRVAIFAFALARGAVDALLFVADPETLRFAAPVRVTSEPFDPALSTPVAGAKHGAWWIGDYQGLAATGDAFLPFWNDTRTGHLELFTAIVR
jgi:hypothetical protein